MAAALVTGASSGIGREIALRLSNMGYDLVLTARNEEGLKQTARRAKTRVIIITADLSKRSELRKIYEKTRKLDIEILVNCAGFGVFGDFAHSDLSKLESMTDVNVTAVHSLMHMFLRDFIKKDHGYILNVASLAAFTSGPLLAAYYAGKSYVYRLSTAVAYELQARGSRVKVCVMCPGPVDTDFNRRAGVDFSVKPISAAYAAACGVRGMLSGKTVVIPGLMCKIAAIALKFIPLDMQLKLCYKIQHKKVQNNK